MSRITNFISELVRAANSVDGLERHERANLLQRAASAVQDCRERIGQSAVPVKENVPGDFAYDLRVLADRVEILTDEVFALTLLTAADAIKGSRVLYEERERIERSEE